MSRPAGYDHRCGICGAHYVPFAADVRCPRCRRYEAVRPVDLVSRAVDLARESLAERGSYRPREWLVTSLGDHLLVVALSVIQRHRKGGGLDAFRPYAEDALDELEWADQEYLRNHVLDFAVRVEAALGDLGTGEGVEPLPE